MRFSRGQGSAARFLRVLLNKRSSRVSCARLQQDLGELPQRFYVLGGRFVVTAGTRLQVLRKTFLQLSSAATENALCVFCGFCGLFSAGCSAGWKPLIRQVGNPGYDGFDSRRQAVDRGIRIRFRAVGVWPAGPRHGSSKGPPTLKGRWLLWILRFSSAATSSASADSRRRARPWSRAAGARAADAGSKKNGVGSPRRPEPCAGARSFGQRPMSPTRPLRKALRFRPAHQKSPLAVSASGRAPRAPLESHPWMLVGESQANLRSGPCWGRGAEEPALAVEPRVSLIPMHAASGSATCGNRPGLPSGTSRLLSCGGKDSNATFLPPSLRQ